MSIWIWSRHSKYVAIVKKCDLITSLHSARRCKNQNGTNMYTCCASTNTRRIVKRVISELQITDALQSLNFVIYHLYSSKDNVTIELIHISTSLERLYYNFWDSYVIPVKRSVQLKYIGFTYRESCNWITNVILSLN